MATRRRRERVGNAILYLGRDWAKRKSMPRDSSGFERLEDYFKPGRDDPETSSDESAMERRVRREVLQRKEKKKRLVRSGGRKAVGGTAVATEGDKLSRQPLPAGSPENSAPIPTTGGSPPTASPLPATASPLPPTTSPLPPTASPLPTTASPLPPTASPLPATASPLPPTASPLPAINGLSALTPGLSPALPPAKIGPTRLSFSASPSDRHYASEATLRLSPPSSSTPAVSSLTGRGRDTEGKEISSGRVQFSTSSAQISVEDTGASKSEPDAQKSLRTVSYAGTTSEMVSDAGTATEITSDAGTAAKSVPDSRDGVGLTFNPKTSTQLKGAKRGISGLSSLSRIHRLLDTDSDSDDGEDLQVLLGRPTPATTLVSLSPGGRGTSKPTTGGSKGRTAPKSNPKSTKKHSSVKPQKSVTVTLDPASHSGTASRSYSVSPVKPTSKRKRARKAPHKNVPVAPPTDDDDVYSFPLEHDEDDVVPSVNDVIPIVDQANPSQGSPADQASPSPVGVMKEMSLVLRREPTPVPVQWFVPEDISRRASGRSRGEKSSSTVDHTLVARSSRSVRERRGAPAESDSDGSVATHAGPRNARRRPRKSKPNGGEEELDGTALDSRRLSTRSRKSAVVPSRRTNSNRDNENNAINFSTAPPKSNASARSRKSTVGSRKRTSSDRDRDSKNDAVNFSVAPPNSGASARKSTTKLPDTRTSKANDADTANLGAARQSIPEGGGALSRRSTGGRGLAGDSSSEGDVDVLDDVSPPVDSGLAGPHLSSSLKSKRASSTGAVGGSEVEGVANPLQIYSDGTPASLKLKTKRRRVKRVSVSVKKKQTTSVRRSRLEGRTPSSVRGSRLEGGRTPGIELTYSAGGRRYRRLQVAPRASHTPGVRRSKRTRIAPVKFWENEEVEYDMRRRSGALLKGVLVPVDPTTPPRRRRRREVKEESVMEEPPPLMMKDSHGNDIERQVVYSLAGATRVDGHGETPRGSEDVVISWLCSSTGTTNGIMTFAPFGEKARCRTDDYELFFYVLGGELLVEVNSQEFLLRPQTEAVVPAGVLYSMKNRLRSKAEVFFYTIHRPVKVEEEEEAI